MDIADVLGLQARRMTQGQQPVARPAWKVFLDGVDMSDELRPYLEALTISERREDAADQLDMILDAAAFSQRLPKAGAVLSVQMGWADEGGGVTAGLIDKGDFIVDEVSHGGPPFTVILRARSADFTASWRMLRDQKWENATLGSILSDIAGRQSVEPRIAEALAAREVALVTQSRQSDIDLLQKLGKDNDAVATIKKGRLIFVPMAGGKTATGETLPVVKIQRSDGDSHDYRVEAREDYTGVTAKWHDKKAAKEKKVEVKGKATVAKRERPTETAGSADNPKVLRKVFANEEEARLAAESEWARIQRAPRKLSFALALGRPDIGADYPVIAEGFHPDIDAEDWIVADVKHSLDNRSGLVTSLECEVPVAAAGEGGDGE